VTTRTCQIQMNQKGDRFHSRRGPKQKSLKHVLVKEAVQKGLSSEGERPAVMGEKKKGKPPGGTVFLERTEEKENCEGRSTAKKRNGRSRARPELRMRIQCGEGRRFPGEKRSFEESLAGTLPQTGVQVKEDESLTREGVDER